MSETEHVLHHHFDDLKQQHEASTLGMWAFLITEVLFFGGLFAGYAQYRIRYPEAYALASHHLDITLGAINTAVLIASSLTMALAVRGAQTGRRKATAGLLMATVALGLVFLVIKSVEYSHKFHEHLVPGSSFTFDGPREAQLFFSFYFAMTGMHALHMIIGVVLVTIIAYFAWRGRYSPKYYSQVEVTGLYWHFVDIVWIFLFPMLYLIGRH